jgi:hypothetical protein
MFIKTQIFDDIISIEEQNLVLQFMESDYKNWEYYSNVSTNDLKSNNTFPGYTINLKEFDLKKLSDITSILKKIEKTVCEKIQMNFLQNIRYKMNCQPPISDYTINQLYRNIHFDMPNDHAVIIYYANDCDAETLFFKNKKGYDAMSNQITMNEANYGNFENVELTESVKPKKGRAVIFDGKTLHCASWPKTGNRYVINFNISLNDKKNINLI